MTFLRQSFLARSIQPRLAWLALIFLSALPALCCMGARAQDWESLLHPIYPMHQTAGEIDAPGGLLILDAPSANANLLRSIPGPISLELTNYVEVGAQRFYLTAEGRDLMWKNQSPYWVSIPGTRRAEFIVGTTPAKLLKRETRDFFKEGLVTAEVFEETVNLAPVTEWSPTYRRAEVDFRLPVKIVAFRTTEGDSWELDLTIFPNFDSNEDRIPGGTPEGYDIYRALITRPVQREMTVRGTANAAKLKGLFIPETIWAAAISEGRIQQLRIGWHNIQTPLEVSRLSPPHFTRSDPMSFRFLTPRILAEPVLFTVIPDEIVGVDWTNYERISDLGGPPSADPDDVSYSVYLQKIWNVTVSSDQIVRVVAPLTEGRGAAGMLELESLGLGPSFEEELKALAAMKNTEAPLLPEPESAEWVSILKNKLGSVPASQRGRETNP